jgi:hypothetical protein
MEKIEYSAIEKEMAKLNLAELQNSIGKSRDNIAAATSAGDIKAEICSVWSKIKPFIIAAEAIPFVGKYLKLLAELLDSLCSA